MLPGIFPSSSIFFQPNSGCGSALNAGVEKAEGKYLSFLGSDDLWTENKLTFKCR